MTHVDRWKESNYSGSRGPHEQGEPRTPQAVAVSQAEAAAKVSVALTRLESGNFSNVKGVGGGVYEDRIDFGPGYRIYLGKDGDQLVILLTGGTKNANKATSIMRGRAGKITNVERQEVDDGSHSRF